MQDRHSRNYSGTFILIAGAVLTAGVLWQTARPAGTHAVMIPPAATTINPTPTTPQTAVLAGGCFWGMEYVFQHVKGVTRVVAGYAGGRASTANYGASSSGQTRQAESVQISYDPKRIRYSDLLRIYFSVAHNPTEIDRQGPDIGREYRSEIFAANPAQARIARAYIRQLNAAGVFPAPIVTRVTEHKAFYPAEAYHQDYAERHPYRVYIRINDVPKLAALQAVFPERYRAQSVNLARGEWKAPPGHAGRLRN